MLLKYLFGSKGVPDDVYVDAKPVVRASIDSENKVLLQIDLLFSLGENFAKMLARHFMWGVIFTILLLFPYKHDKGIYIWVLFLLGGNTCIRE